VSFFKHHRKVEHREGPPTRELAPVKKSIYSLIDLREILLGCNRRYLAHLSALDDFSAGVRALGRLTKPRKVEAKTVKGINFFEPGDAALLHALQNPRVNIAGIRRRDLLGELEMFSPNRLSHHLRRLLDLGVIKRITPRDSESGTRVRSWIDEREMTLDEIDLDLPEPLEELDPDLHAGEIEDAPAVDCA
jgi:DNA-binding transcriptional ArsR family regulator